MDIKEKAKQFAIKAHEGQTRKSSGAPYIGHPLHVAKILEDAGMPDAVVCAGHLHDTVEDTDVTLEQIKNEFGEEIHEYVEFNTEDKNKTWEERKEHTVEQLKEATVYKKALVVADKYSNLLELVRNHKKLGDDLWKCFKRGKDQQYWYFANVAKSGKANLSPEEIPPFFYEYEKAVEEFFKNV